LRRLAYRHISAVVTQSQDGRIRFANNGITAKIIPNSISEFKDSRQWNKKTLSTDEISVLTIARFEHVKQIHHFVFSAGLILKNHPNVKFQIVGSGPTEGEIRKNIKKLGLGNAIKIYPPSNNISKHYESADIYLITSSSEAFPMTLLEAMSFGLVVVSYDELVGPREVIEHGVNGLLCQQNNFRALSSAVTKILSDSKKMQKLSDGALAHMAKFRSEKIESDWLDIV
jgi:poly(glycerol-phosphate) alpha-glucosyltransferase